MNAARPWLNRMVVALAPLFLALVLTTLILVAVGAPPLETYAKLFTGSLGTAIKQADVAVVWTSIVIASAGLLITFTAGQWNIGMEGQITAGAIFATWAARSFINEDGALIAGSPIVMLIACFVAGVAGGVLWAVAAGALKIYGRVNEIFSGLGLNFIATGLGIYLMFGPWKQKTGGTLSGTTLWEPELWLPTLPGLRVSVIGLVLAVIVVVLVYFALRGTVWGLQLKAVGRNAQGAHTLGIRTERTLFSAYAVCGVCAGLIGAYLVTGVHHRLIPSISSGYGFLGILIVLLSGFRAIWLAPIAIFFSAVAIGSTSLQLDLQLDSSLGGVLQGVLVLAVLFVQGWRETLGKRKG